MNKTIKKIICIVLCFCFLSVYGLTFPQKAYATGTDTALYGDVTVDFNDITSATISGVYGGIDWGTDLWQRGGPAGEYMNSTNIATNTHWGDENWGPANVSGLPLVDPIATNVIKLPAGTVLKSFQVVGNDSTDNGTVTVSSPGNPDVTAQLEGQNA